MISHLAVFTSDDNSEDNRLIFTLVKSVNFFDDMGVGLQDVKPNLGITSVTAGTGIDHCTNFRALVNGGIQTTKYKADMRKLPINSQWKGRRMVACLHNRNDGKVHRGLEVLWLPAVPAMVGASCAMC